MKERMDLGWGLVLSLAAACTAAVPDVPSSPSSMGAPSIDIVTPPGVPDRGDDPAVVAIVTAGAPACAGALVAPDVVLTARHCVSEGAWPPSCSPGRNEPVVLRSPESLRVVVGEDLVTGVERARGTDILVPKAASPCVPDAALLLLDRPIDDVQPLAVRATGAAEGDHVRVVGFGRSGAGGSTTMKLLREHVPVTAATQTQLELAEDGCFGACGGPALDEATGEVLGIGSRRALGVAQGATGSVYVRADAIFALIEQGLARSAGVVASGHAGRLKAKKGPVDVGAICVHAADCAAGVCVTESGARYCSRTCGAHDKCPTHFRCEAGDNGGQACTES